MSYDHFVVIIALIGLVVLFFAESRGLWNKRK